jgi:TolA-binding protein
MSYEHPYQYYSRGLQLMQEGKFTAAISAFDRYLEAGDNAQKRSDAAYYKALCAIQLQNLDGEALIEQYIRDYPNARKAQLAYFELGKLAYGEKEYKKAIEYFNKTYFSSLNSADLEEARFKLGYSHFTQRQFDEAYEQFNELKRKVNPYQYPASYYAGYINYEQGEYDRAYYDFKRIEDNEAYARVVPSLLVKVMFSQGRYDELIGYASTALEKPEVSEKQELHMYLGEAYYKTQQYKDALLHYSAYLDKTRAKPARPLLFRIADCRQKTGDVATAIEYMKEVALEDDTLGLYASYYLGDLYLQTENNPYAITAYLRARDGKVDEVIREEAAFKYAKLLYAMGNYDMAIQAIDYYRTVFPESNRLTEADEILTRAYLHSRNYDAAIAHFEGIKQRTPVLEAAYQKVTFLKGTELFNAQQFASAVEMFDLSIDHGVNRDYVIKAWFWKGEAYAIGNKSDQAEACYAAVFRYDPDGRTTEYLRARYGMGYILFNRKEYARALTHFKYYTDAMRDARDRSNFSDALTRLADCYYATKQYERALVVLNEVIALDEGQADYAYFRKGVIYSVQGDLATANDNFDRVISGYPDSRHHVNALYQKGRFNFEAGNYPLAIDLFSRVITNYPESPFTPYAYQDRAIAYFNIRKPEQSASDYIELLEKYPSHDVAGDALLGLQDVLGDLGRSNAFEKYLVMYKNANPGSEELESIEYGAAKTLYFNQNYTDAIPSFERFLRSYSESPFRTEAQFYYADALYRAGETDKALNVFYTLAGEQQFNRYARVIQRIVEIEYDLGHYQSAIDQARVLDKVAANKRDAFLAWNTQMRGFYHLQQYDSVDKYGQLILDKGLVTPDAEGSTALLMGKSAYHQGNTERAQELFARTASIAQDENGAEALYMMALIQHEQGDFARSLETLFDLNSKYAAYDRWLGRSFILIAENYIAQEEYFQARATLESVVSNAPEQEIVDMAKMRLNEIEALQPAPVENVPDTLEINENEQE